MTKIKYLLLFLLCFISCKNGMKFDSSKWNEKNDIGCYIYRKNMIDDIIENDLVKGKSIAELEKMFGTLEVEIIDNQKAISQNIEIDYGLNIDPVGSTDFIIYLDNEDKVTNTKIESFHK